MIDWSKYVFSVEAMPAAKGGGYRAVCPDFGLAVYGVGDTVEETLASLEGCKEYFDEYVQKRPGWNHGFATI